MNWCNNAFPVTMHKGNYHITGLYEWILKVGSKNHYLLFHYV